MPSEETLMKVIGLTGGIASGKSLVSRFFEIENVVVLDADKIYKNLLKRDKIMYNEIKNAFSLTELDLKTLSDIVFNDEEKLKILNSIAHPYVKRAILERIQRLKKTEKLIVLDIPLLFEAKMENLCDQIICVYAEEKVQLERLLKRNDLSLDSALKRINSQMPLKEKCKLSDYVIDNSLDIDNTYRQFKNLFNKIKE
ncbi:MAG: dephospho-CoA kinase [Candidatus Izemoplasmatales bacterium]|nr:dephospho-CoA kinase [Candidatus Izemoplasmatales bacterium]